MAFESGINVLGRDEQKWQSLSVMTPSKANRREIQDVILHGDGLIIPNGYLVKRVWRISRAQSGGARLQKTNCIIHNASDVVVG